MNIYAIPPLISSLLFLFFGIFVLHKAANRPGSVGFFLSTFSTFWWQFIWAILFSIGTQDNAFFIVRVAYSGITFIPITLFHFFADYTENVRAKKWVKIYYFLGIVFLAFLWMTDLYIAGFYKHFYGYYPRAGYLHPLFLLLTAIAALHIFHYLILTGKTVGWRGARGLQAKWLIVALFIYCLAATDFLVNYGVVFYPLGFLALLICLFIIGYAVSKYNLFEISLVITRATIFVFIYAIVLGVPFWIGQRTGWWIFSTGLMAVFATLGPFIYTNLRLAVEKKFFHEQKLELAHHAQTRRQHAMDNFSASLAYEIQNPVCAVLGRAAMVRESIVNDLKGKVDEKLVDYYTKRLSGIEDDVSRIASIIKAVREYSSCTKAEHEKICLNELIQSFLYLAGPQFKKEEINFTLDIPKDICVMGNKVQLEELLLNLADNAIHALTAVSGKQITLSVKQAPDNKVLIEFKDNGYGIPKKLLEDIFLDFVTTKGSSEGLGMGLSQARKIIAAHNGRIWAESDGEDKGAVIFIELPLSV